MAALAYALTEQHPEEVANVLLVSSNQRNLAQLKSILGRSGWQLEEACGCQKGLRALSDRRFPVVICECELPDGDWKEFLDAAASANPAPRMIVCSRLADELLWTEVLKLGGFDVLAMPFDAREVLRLVHLAWDSWEWESRRMAARRKRPFLVESGHKALRHQPGLQLVR
jgi:DNA-binding NtrC family response regulator